MSDLMVFIYFLCFAAIAGSAFALMWKNIYDINHSRKTKSLHPELSETKDGDELMTINFIPEVDLQFTPDEQFNDLFLKKSLEKRMEELEDDGENTSTVIK